MKENEKKLGAVTFIGDGSAPAGDLITALRGDFQVTTVGYDADVAEHSGTECPDLIVVDSGEDNGLDLHARLKDAPWSSDVDIVVLCDDEESQMASLEMGARDCMSRSVSPGLLKSKIGRLIGRRRAEDELRRSERKAREKAEELESIVEMVTHDLKSPVNAIGGFVRLLGKRFNKVFLEAGAEEVLHHLSETSATMEDFLKDLSDCLITEKIEPEWNPVHLHETVEEVVRQNAHLMAERSIRIELKLGETGVRVVGDRHRIVQVLDNLLVNAIRHMGNRRDPLIIVELDDDREFVIARVSDNGAGIPPDYHMKIFRRFVKVPGRGRTSGSGLGLYIAKAIVESHGGEMWVESEIDRGATFCFTIPKNAPPALSES